MPKRLIVHCGLHKTGTTALQRFMLAGIGPLRDLGILVPQTGRLDGFGGGHHNIAWELNRDRRFNRTLGTLGELIEEVAGFEGDIIVSSEDFETTLAKPSRLAPLLFHPRLADRQVLVVIYLRDQISYAEGLFSENIGHGFGDECAQVMQEIVARGELALREWRFQFDYERLWRSATALAPAQAVFRAYCPPSAGGIVADFMGALFPHIPLSPITASPVTVNPRWNFPDALAHFHANRLGHTPSDRERALLQILSNRVGDRPVVLSAILRRLFANRFMPGNQAVNQALGLPPATLDLAGRTAPAEPPPYLFDRVFSFETSVVVTALSDLLPLDINPVSPDASRIAPGAAAVIEGLLEAWRTERPPP